MTTFRAVWAIVITLFLLLGAPHLQAGDSTITGRVVWVTDGDTLTVTTGSVFERNLKKHRIRLAEIDAPESDQDYGRKAANALRGMAFGKKITINVVDKDQHGRLVGRVYAPRHGETIDVNAELVRLGLAWTYPQYVRDQNLITLEAEAKSERRGLWAQNENERIAPWDWRRNR